MRRVMYDFAASNCNIISSDLYVWKVTEWIRQSQFVP